MTILPDIRLTNLVRDWIRPPQKQGFKTRNLAYLKLVLQPKTNCLLMPTFPASGANWSDDIINYVLSKYTYGSYEQVIDTDKVAFRNSIRAKYFSFVPADARALSSPPFSSTFPNLNIDYAFHTHGFWKESGLWFLDNAKTVMITRHIPTSLYSYYSKRRQTYNNFDACLQDTGLINRVIGFYNSWNQYKKQHKNNFYTYKYEECRTHPVRTFGDVLYYMFQVRFDDALITEAVDYFSFDKQKKRESQVTDNEKKHFHYKGQTSYFNEIQTDTYIRILQQLIDRLDNNFGYDYNAELDTLSACTQNTV